MGGELPNLCFILFLKFLKFEIFEYKIQKRNLTLLSISLECNDVNDFYDLSMSQHL